MKHFPSPISFGFYKSPRLKGFRSPSFTSFTNFQHSWGAVALGLLWVFFFFLNRTGKKSCSETSWPSVVYCGCNGGLTCLEGCHLQETTPPPREVTAVYKLSHERTKTVYWKVEVFLWCVPIGSGSGSGQVQVYDGADFHKIRLNILFVYISTSRNQTSTRLDVCFDRNKWGIFHKSC